MTVSIINTLSLLVLISIYGISEFGIARGATNVRDTICARFPTFSSCGNAQQQDPQQQQQRSISQSGQITQADLPQPSSSSASASSDGSASSSSSSTSSSSSSDDNTASYCQQYRDQYPRLCTSSENGVSTNDPAYSFCRSYATNCIVQSSSPAAQQSGGSGGSADGARAKAGTGTGASGSGGDDLRQKIAYCTGYQNAYGKYCSGKRPSGRVATFCQAYLEYCSSVPSAADESGSAPAAPSGHASGGSASAPMPNANSSAEIKRLCEQYAWMANRSCPGFEAQDARQNCNLYRVYCQGKEPVPSVDGGFGWTKDDWGVGGIPYYPFNPQGSIGGGERNNVGFGDWGGNFKQRKGVNDFWDTTKQANANWQKGDFGFNQGWNVPLLGIGGYKGDDVNVGGLLNPSQVPAVSTGGVLPTAGGAPPQPAAGTGAASPGLLTGLANILGGGRRK